MLKFKKDCTLKKPSNASITLEEKQDDNLWLEKPSMGLPDCGDQLI